MSKINQLLEEFIGGENIRSKNSIWGITTLSPLHLGLDKFIYFQKELINLGYNHTIILDDFKDPPGNLQIKYYKSVINLLGLKKIKIMRSSIFRKNGKYLDLFREICLKSRTQSQQAAEYVNSKLITN